MLLSADANMSCSGGPASQRLEIQVTGSERETQRERENANERQRENEREGERARGNKREREKEGKAMSSYGHIPGYDAGK